MNLRLTAQRLERLAAAAAATREDEQKKAEQKTTEKRQERERIESHKIKLEHDDSFYEKKVMTTFDRTLLTCSVRIFRQSNSSNKDFFGSNLKSNFT